MNKTIVILGFFLTLAVLPACSTEKQNDKEQIDPTVKNIETNQDTVVAVVEEEVIDLSSAGSQMEYMKQSKNWEKYESGILPQMTEDAPSYVKDILESDSKHFIIVDKAKMKLFLYDIYGNVEKSYGIACAKNFGTKRKKGDSRTTEGSFKVVGVFDSTNWLFTNDEGYTSPVKGQYGPRFIRLNIPYIGIHGTGSPGSIGRRCSHGCIRVTNPNILELVKYVEEGMPVIISPGPKDMAVNQKEGSNILSVATEVGTSKAYPGKGPVYQSAPVAKANVAEETKAEENNGSNVSESTVEKIEVSNMPESGAEMNSSAPSSETIPVESNPSSEE